MLKARRKEAEQLRFPEPREGLPEDPRPFLGLSHSQAAATVQEHLSSRCLVAVVGRTGAGKSTVVRRAANSRWARQWFLRDEQGQPAHRRFWVDLEDCAPGQECGERVAHALGRKTFPEAVARLRAGPCLLVLDNADAAFLSTRSFSTAPEAPTGAEMDQTLAALVDCADHGASVVVTRRKVSDLAIGRPWTDVVEVTGFDGDEDATELFVSRAPRVGTDLRLGELIDACDRLPQAVALLSGAAADGDLEVVRLRVATVVEGLKGLDFALPVTFAMLDADDRAAWGALSLLPSGLSESDVGGVLNWIDGARERLIHLSTVGVVRRCEAGVRVPYSLRLPPIAAGLSAATVDAVWESYVSWGRTIVGPIPSLVGPGGPPVGAAATSAVADAEPSPGTGTAAVRGRGGRNDRSRRWQPAPSRPDTRGADAWLSRQGATLSALAGRPALDEGTFDLACAGLLLHSSGREADALDRTLLRLIGALLAPPSPTAAEEVEPGAGPGAEPGAGPAAEPAAEGGAGDEPAVEADGAGAREPEVDTMAEAIANDGESEQVDVSSATVETPEPAVVDSPDAARAARVSVASRIAAVLEDQRRFGTSVLLSRGVVAFLRPAGDVRRLADALCQLGRTERFSTDYPDAVTHLDEARQLFESQGDQVGMGTARFELGLVDLELGRLDTGESHLEAARNHFATQSRPVGEANASLELVRIDLARGRIDRAEERLEYAIRRYEDAGDSLGYANASLQLGQVELARGRVDDAERLFVNALDGYEQASDKVGFANACLQLGQVELARGRLDSAERRFGGALSGYELVGEALGVANVSLQLGQIELARGRLPQSEQRLQQALATYELLGDRIGVANATLQLSQVALGRGLAAEADDMVQAAQSAYDAIGDRLGAANARQVRAFVCQTQGQNPDALVLFGEAARMYDAVGRMANAGMSLAGAARVCIDKVDRRAYVTGAVQHLLDAGLVEAARQVEGEFAEPDPPPTEVATEAQEEPVADTRSSAWPRPDHDAAPAAAVAAPVSDRPLDLVSTETTGTDGDGVQTAADPTSDISGSSNAFEVAPKVSGMGDGEVSERSNDVQVAPEEVREDSAEPRRSSFFGRLRGGRGKGR